MDYGAYKHLVIERNERGVLYVRFNNPQKLNPIHKALHEELSTVFVDIARDRETKVVVITGEGNAFSAGGDLSGMGKNKDIHIAYKAVREAYDILRRLVELPQPVIARVNGHAIGLGATIALYCDIIVAEEQAKISDPHVQVGIVAGDGGAGIWPLVLGPAKAKRYLLTGDPLTARDAEKLGLITEAVPLDDLDQRVEYWIERMVNGPQLAIQLTKRAVNRHLKKVLDDIVEPSVFLEAITFQSEDYDEAIHAFMENRKPKFNAKKER